MISTRIDLCALCAILAPHLPGYTAGPAADGPWVQRLTGYDDREIYLQQRDGRIYVSGNYPGGYHPGRIYVDGQPLPAVHISVSADREPAAIVKEIQRRFLPEYERVYALCAASAAEGAAWEQQQEALLQRLVEIVHLAPSRSRYGTVLHFYSDRNVPGALSGKVQVNGPDSVDVELRLSAAQAERLLRFLATAGE